MSAKLEGDKALKRALRRNADKIDGAAEAAVQSGAKIIENSAKRDVPRRTGNLARSIHTETTKSGSEIKADIGTDVDYAEAVEKGTSNQRAQPYLRPALDNNEDRALREIDGAFKEIVRSWKK